jgi:hypothetical protein
MPFGGKLPGNGALPNQSDDPRSTDKRAMAQHSVKGFFLDNALYGLYKGGSYTINNGYNADPGAARNPIHDVGDIVVSGEFRARLPRSNPLALKRIHETGQTVSLGLLLEHDGGAQTFISIPRAYIPSYSPDIGAASSSCTCGFDADEGPHGFTIAIYRNWE